MAHTVPANDNGDVAAHLAALVTGRSAALDRIIVAARHAELGALLLIGSLGRGGGDAWSDLDLIAVPGPRFDRLDLVKVFGEQVLAVLDAPRNAPIGGDYVGLCLDVAGMALWIDWYLWPQDTATVPADASAVYDDLGLPHSDRDFIALITANSNPSAPAHPANAATTLLRIAVAAKYLARADLPRLSAKLPDVQGLSPAQVAARLHGKLAGIHEPGLTRAVAATRRLLDLAVTASGYPRTGLADHVGTQGNPIADPAVGLA
jgi:hypothetical protein